MLSWWDYRARNAPSRHTELVVFNPGSSRINQTFKNYSLRSHCPFEATSSFFFSSLQDGKLRIWEPDWANTLNFLGLLVGAVKSSANRTGAGNLNVLLVQDVKGQLIRFQW